MTRIWTLRLNLEWETLMEWTHTSHAKHLQCTCGRRIRTALNRWQSPVQVWTSLYSNCIFFILLYLWLNSVANTYVPLSAFYTLDECKHLKINLDRLTSVNLKVLGHGTLPVCYSYGALFLWYNDDSRVADNLYFQSTFSICNYGEWQVNELVTGHLITGRNEHKSNPLFDYV